MHAFLTEYADYLVKERGYDVTFICSPDEKLAAMTSDRMHFLPVPMKRGVGLDGPKVIRTLKQIFEREQFDVIQYSTPNAALYASIAARKAHCRNRLYCQWGIRYMGFDGGIKRAVFKAIEKTTCKNSTVVECESQSLYRFSLEEGLYPEEKGSVIGNGSACGVNLSKFDYAKKDGWRREIRTELGIPEETVVFGYTGRITRDKGANELLAAFRALPENADACLMMVGTFDQEGTIDPELREWAESDSRVRFVGWTDETERYYSAMDVFVSISYREGFGLVVIEAAALGTPAIVTDVPGQVDTIVPEEEGILVPAKAVEPVTEAMMRYISDRALIKTMGEKARKRCETLFEQKHLFSQLADHKDALIAEGR